MVGHVKQADISTAVVKLNNPNNAQKPALSKPHRRPSRRKTWSQGATGLDHRAGDNMIALEEEREGPTAKNARRSQVTEAWSKVESLTRDYNQETLEGINQELDTFLVFTGLFSAVVTAFIAISYQSLQQDPQDLSTQALIQISQQLSSLSINGNFINSTIPAVPTTTPFKAPTIFIFINILWVTSLAISLMISFCVMLLKYALRLMAYEQRLQGITQPCPKELRAFFFYLLEDTPPFRMCIGFPFILTPAVIMFLIGLLLFLIHLNSLVAGLAFLCVELPILLFLFVIIVPYWEVILRNHRNSSAPRILDSERAAVQQREWDVSVLTSADKIVQRDDVKLLAIAQDCLAETVPEDVYSYLRHILPRRSGIGWEVLSSLKDAPDYLYDNVPEATLREVGKMLVDLVKRVLRGGPKHWDDLDEGVSFLAQIESWNLLEGFPELFGSITAISVEYAKGVVEALSDSGWTFVPRLVSSEAHHNLLQGASEVLQEEKVEFPPELCQGVLKVAVAADDATVRENITEFRYVIQKAVLAMEQRQHVDSETLSTDEEATKMMNDSLEMVNSLNHRFPGLVREGTLNILTDVQNWHLKEADDEPDGGEGSPETLGLFTQIMARFSGRKRVVYHEASSADFQVETVEMA